MVPGPVTGARFVSPVHAGDANERLWPQQGASSEAPVQVGGLDSKAPTPTPWRYRWCMEAIAGADDA